MGRRLLTTQSTEIQGLVFWLDETTIESGVGGNVTGWRDKSGAGICSGVYAVDGYPTASTMNGLDCVEFTSPPYGYGPRLYNASTTPIENMNPSTIFAVYQFTVLGSGNNDGYGVWQIDNYPPGPNQVGYCTVDHNGDVVYYGNYGGGSAEVHELINLETDSPNIICCQYDASVHLIKLNNYAPNTESPTDYAKSLNRINIAYTDANSPFGKIGEIRVYNRGLSEDERNQVMAELGAKWASGVAS